jgi:nicotinamide mononucleotide (NMN) deamidase PncC
LSAERIKRIFDSGFRAALVVTGGGSGALHALLSTPGASSFVADARIPYSPEALEDFLHEPVDQSCSPETAVKMARAACKFPNIGISCTAALRTDRERRGADRAFICIKTAEVEKLYAIYFSKASRSEQEVLLSDWLIVLIAHAVGAERNLILPGSFNPLHQGHCNLLRVAENLTGLRGVFELSAANVDKPDIPEDELLRRAAQIRDIPVALTRAPRFTQKAELFPNTTFVLGYDTAARLVDPAYSKDWKNQWKRFQTLETKFLVAGRLSQPLEKEVALAPRSAEPRRSRFQCLENLELPDGFEVFFEPIPESMFREDVSSTDLRG